MVNANSTGGEDPERGLVLSYAPGSARAGLAALLALDARLGAIVRSATDPTIGLMRLTWWSDALTALDTGPAPAEPILTGLAAEVLPTGVRGDTLARMTDGWERLLDGGPLDAEALADFAQERGGTLFSAAAVVLGATDARIGALGEGWALADLATHLSDPQTAAVAGTIAKERLRTAFGRPWASELRALGALGLLARSDLASGRRGAPARVGRLLLHRMTGR